LVLDETTAVRTPRASSCSTQRHRAGERVDPAVGEHALDQCLLARGDLAHRRLAGVDPARAQEIAHAVEPRLAVDVREIVALDVERLVEHFVERLLPRRRVQRGGRGEDAVEIEQDGVEVGGSRIHAPSLQRPARAHIGALPLSHTLKRVERRQQVSFATSAGRRCPPRGRAKGGIRCPGSRVGSRSPSRL
jgi:hypothetical protein